MVHAQAAHSMHIYEYKDDENDDEESMAKENISQHASLGNTNDAIISSIHDFTNEVPLNQPPEQSFLPQSQAAILGDRSH